MSVESFDPFDEDDFVSDVLLLDDEGQTFTHTTVDEALRADVVLAQYVSHTERFRAAMI